MHEDTLDRDFVGPEFVRHLVDAGEDFLQAFRQRLAGRANGAAHEIGDLYAGVDVPAGPPAGLGPLL